MKQSFSDDGGYSQRFGPLRPFSSIPFYLTDFTCKVTRIELQIPKSLMRISKNFDIVDLYVQNKD